MLKSCIMYVLTERTDVYSMHTPCKSVVLHVFELEFQAVGCCTCYMYGLYRETASKHDIVLVQFVMKR